jgi:hypothetical protein
MPQQIGGEGFIPSGFLLELFKCEKFLHEQINLFNYHSVISDILVDMNCDSLPFNYEIGKYLFRIQCIEEYCFRFTILNEQSEYCGCSMLLSLESNSEDISHIEIDFSTWTLDPQFIAERVRSCEDGVPLYKITVYQNSSLYIIFVRILLQISVMDDRYFVAERFLEEEEEEEDAIVFARLRFEESVYTDEDLKWDNPPEVDCLSIHLSATFPLKIR